MAIKDRLKELRKSQKLSQQELAEKLGVATSTLQRYEYGQTPPIEILKQYAKIFNVSINELIDITADELLKKFNAESEELVTYYDVINKKLMSEFKDIALIHFKHFLEEHLTCEEIESIYKFANFIYSQREQK